MPVWLGLGRKHVLPWNKGDIQLTRVVRGDLDRPSPSFVDGFTIILPFVPNFARTRC